MPLITQANATAPRRYRSTIPWPIDLAITPPTTPYGGPGTPGQIINGELVYITANNKLASLATAGAANSNTASCVGIAEETYPTVIAAGIISGTPPNDFQGAAQGLTPMLGVYTDGDHLMNATAGDVYQPGQAVYLGSDGRTITVAASGTKVGNVSPDQRQVNPVGTGPIAFGVAATAGQQIYIRLIPAVIS